MNHLPFYVPFAFVLATFLTIYLFFKASNNNLKTLMVIVGWMTIQSAIAVTGFFEVTNTIPPRFFMLVAIPFITIATVFSTGKGRNFIDRFNLKTLTILHSIRVLVELVLFWLFLNKVVPQLMTFEGRNFDLLSGVSAPLIYYFGFVKGKIGWKAMLAWNFICLTILLFTVSNAILSAPTPFQKFAFEQPMVAVLYFPFGWLPGVVVPLVIFSHLIGIRLLLKERQHRTSRLLVKQVA